MKGNIHDTLRGLRTHCYSPVTFQEMMNDILRGLINTGEVAASVYGQCPRKNRGEREA